MATVAERARNGHLNRVKLLMVVARVEFVVMAIINKMGAVKLMMIATVGLIKMTIVNNAPNEGYDVLPCLSAGLSTDVVDFVEDHIPNHGDDDSVDASGFKSHTSDSWPKHCGLG